VPTNQDAGFLSRGIQFVEKAPKEVLSEALAKVRAIVCESKEREMKKGAS
jgi:hypothetical protein